MANTKSRKGVREPRLYWHELPLGPLTIGGEVNPHQIRETLFPLVLSAVLKVIHVTRWSFTDPVDLFDDCENFRISHSMPLLGVAQALGDGYEMRLVYAMSAKCANRFGDRRHFRRVQRRRLLLGWLAAGCQGGVSLYLRRHRRWKGGRYLVEG